ncbi:MAG: hypothetical protein WBV11_10490 [Salegentibacter sp.]
MKKYVLILISIASITGCSKNNDSLEPEMVQADKVIFGEVYGMCGGDCRDLYLINNEGLYKDADNASDEYGDWAETTFDERMDQEDPANIKDLLSVPSSLLENNSSEEIIVQSWADIDYYLYIEKDGKSKELLLDHIHRDASPEIKSYFKVFLKSYKGLGGSMIDTTDIERYY